MKGSFYGGVCKKAAVTCGLFVFKKRELHSFPWCMLNFIYDILKAEMNEILIILIMIIIKIVVRVLHEA